MKCHIDENSELFLSDSTGIFIKNQINNDHEIIISRYSEDISWIKYLPAKIILYNKGAKYDIKYQRGNITTIYLDNIGREGHTYLYHIINNYDNLKKTTTFLQGNPFEHSPNIIELLCMVEDYEDIQSLSIWYIKNRIPCKNTIYKYLNYLNGAMYAKYLILDNLHLCDFTTDQGIYTIQNNYKLENNINDEKIISHFLNKCGINIYKNNYNFIYSALFSINKSNILNNKKEVYMNIMNELLRFNKQGGVNGYILERIWHTLFEKIF